jgi:hypothetical protein
VGVVAGAAGVQRLGCWAVGAALGPEGQRCGGPRPLRVVAEASCSPAACLNALVAAGVTGLSRRRQAAVGGDAPAPGVGPRRRGRPRQQGPAWPLAPRRRGAARTALLGPIDGQAERLQVGWRDAWRRDVPCQGRVVILAMKPEPLPVASPDLTLPPAVISQRSAARLPIERSLRELQPSGGLGD